MKLIDGAFEALRRSPTLRVFPLQPNSKIPAVKHGVLAATRDEKIVSRWWQRNPFFGIGVTGVVIVDSDSGLEDPESSRCFLLEHNLPMTFAVRTGGRPGFRVQFYFEGQTATRLYESRGVRGEVRGNRTYGIYPPSIHPISGQAYEVLWDLPIAQWPAGVELGKPHREFRASAHPGQDSETTIENALETFERLLDEAAHAVEGSRNYTAHKVAWFAARCALAGLFENPNDIAKRIGAAVRPHYRNDKRDVSRMLQDSWNYGLRAGRLELDFYPADFARLRQLSDDEKFQRAFDGNTADFGSAAEARTYLEQQLETVGFNQQEVNRVLRHSEIDEAAAAELLKELETK